MRCDDEKLTAALCSYEIAYKLIPLCATDVLIYVEFIADRRNAPEQAFSTCVPNLD